MYVKNFISFLIQTEISFLKCYFSFLFFSPPSLIHTNKIITNQNKKQKNPTRICAYLKVSPLHISEVLLKETPFIIRLAGISPSQGHQNPAFKIMYCMWLSGGGEEMSIVPKSIARLQIHLQVYGMLMKKSSYFIKGLGKD